ncbi:olfactory receptor 6N1-like [Pseudophryne corroboree]|uniref:olfactory receptor 6N1-like n=1 Tax=Pseudophryne corroboree TaxID=495146 RepID=UPI0030815B53
MYNNQTVSTFVILGFHNIIQYQKFTFILFLLLYIFIIAGNTIIILVIYFDSHLHIPMYIFISILSVVEISIVTTVYPTLFALFLNGKVYISFNCCFLQMYAFDAFLVTENFLLTVMSYDRYVAICFALRYHTIMTSKTSKILICLCWLLGFLSPLAMIIMVYRLPFCGPNEIDHIFCDSSPLLTLACTNSNLDVTMDLSVSSFTIILNSLFIGIIYINILSTILKMRSSEERKKAFSICMSHLIMALVFYGSVAFMYIQLQASYSPEYDLATAIHQSILTPLLSPLIYSFRNKEIKNFIKKQFSSKTIIRKTNYAQRLGRNI